MLSTAADMAPMVRALARRAAPGTAAATWCALASATAAAAPSRAVATGHSDAVPPARATMPCTAQPQGPDHSTIPARTPGRWPSAAQAASPANAAASTSPAGVARRSQRQLAGYRSIRPAAPAARAKSSAVDAIATPASRST